MTEEQLAVFYDKLAAHDWFYHYSDHGPTFRAGEQNQKVLAREAGQDLKTVEMFVAFKLYKFEDGDKPLRPTGEKPVFVSEIGF